MNKKGYTLAEALVTLGIIGIIAALVVPAANKARPNENKIKFLQTYDAIETQIKNFTQNTRYFPTCQDFPDPVDPLNTITRCFPDYPLFNTSSGVHNYVLGVDGRETDQLEPNGILYGIMNNSNDNDKKLCYLLADAMGIDTSPENRCNALANQSDFETPNGVQIDVRSIIKPDRSQGHFQIRIFLDGRNADLSPNNVNPTAFTLYVTTDGNIYPGDRASAYYLATRKDTRGNLDVPAATINAVLDSKYGQHDNFDSIASDESKIRVIFSN